MLHVRILIRDIQRSLFSMGCSLYWMPCLLVLYMLWLPFMFIPILSLVVKWFTSSDFFFSTPSLTSINLYNWRRHSVVLSVISLTMIFRSLLRVSYSGQLSFLSHLELTLQKRRKWEEKTSKTPGERAPRVSFWVGKGPRGYLSGWGKGPTDIFLGGERAPRVSSPGNTGGWANGPWERVGAPLETDISAG